jgi:AcrR family transcriptional regulator
MSSTETDTHRRILYHTWKLMEQKHGQEVRVQDIANAVGISRQAVYLHFPSRAGLLAATTHYLDEVLCPPERLSAFCDATNGVAKLDGYVDFWGNYIPEIYGLAKSLIVLAEMDEAAKAAWGERMQDVRNSCREVVTLLAKEGKLAQPWTEDQAVDLMWAALAVENWEKLTLQSGWLQTQYVAGMKHLLRQMLVREVGQ